ncbi:hypothetical protein K1T71_006618 [Dendrolimus kikuchii]|uniref:Uncharacterized protein n=1 Tax=Dendrolimus kikuchii TaxID=765133 RepID=A0ACC1D1P9_9NEOP|nr:hypothetical protein K1T71_006618 [Dendrolimus kikuchii]
MALMEVRSREKDPSFELPGAVLIARVRSPGYACASPDPLAGAAPRRRRHAAPGGWRPRYAKVGESTEEFAVCTDVVTRRDA